MVDLSQVLLIIVITALTILLSLIGIQIVHILREVKKSLEKINKILDDAGMITESVAHPIAGLGGMFEGLRSAVKAIETIGVFFARRKKSKDTPSQEKQSG